MEQVLYSEEVRRNQRQRRINLYCANDCNRNGTTACLTCALKARPFIFEGKVIDRKDKHLPSFFGGVEA